MKTYTILTEGYEAGIPFDDVEDFHVDFDGDDWVEVGLKPEAGGGTEVFRNVVSWWLTEDDGASDE